MSTTERAGAGGARLAARVRAAWCAALGVALAAAMPAMAATAAMAASSAGGSETGAAAAKAALTGRIEAGRAEFARCQWCHQAGPAARSGFGPQLTGIVGRRAGAATDFRYSEAMKNSGIVWTEPVLAAFVKAPQDVIPGNRMRFWGISDPQRIANLLAYLRTL